MPPEPSPPGEEEELVQQVAEFDTNLTPSPSPVQVTIAPSYGSILDGLKKLPTWVMIGIGILLAFLLKGKR